MIEVSSMVKKDLSKLVKPMLPVYVISEDKSEIFVAKDISNNMFRDEPAIEMYSIKSKELQPMYPKCNTLRITSGQYITKDLEEADHFFNMKKAQKIKKEYTTVKEQYLDYTKFIEEHPEYFLI